MLGRAFYKQGRSLPIFLAPTIYSVALYSPRYNSPIIPLLIISQAILLYQIWNWIRSRAKTLRPDRNAMTKLIIQIPCFNEAGTLPTTLHALPREIEGVRVVEWLVIDDGSIDDTVQIARTHGVDHVISLPQNEGLAKAFMAGIDACLKRDADIIVNTDADNQYRADCIPDLIEPILSNQAEIVIGCRPVMNIRHFSPIKKLLQKAGSWAVRKVSGTDIPDAPSGFRAFSREAAMRFFVTDSYTYTLETIIQAGKSDRMITWVPVQVNEDLRPSRLVRSIPSYVLRSISTIARVFLIYRSFPLLFGLGALMIFPGLVLGCRFVYFYITGDGQGHIQSLILSGLLISMGFLTCVTGIIAHLIGVNRKLLEDIRLRQIRDSANHPDGQQ